MQRQRGKWNKKSFPPIPFKKTDFSAGGTFGELYGPNRNATAFAGGFGGGMFRDGWRSPTENNPPAAGLNPQPGDVPDN